jgi:hypothetical protein
MSEHEQLRKKSYLSHLYHFGYENQGVARDAPLLQRKSMYIAKPAQVRAENLIDTESKAVPDIPHGRLSSENFQRLKKQVEVLKRQGGVILFTGIEREMKETPENTQNLLEAHANIRRFPLLGKKPFELSVYEKKPRDSGDADKPTIHDIWNTLARANLTDLGVADAKSFQVQSVHLVDDVAERYHNDLLGLGQSPLVTVMKANNPYYVLFAAVKQGDCPADALILHGADDDETAAVPPPGNVASLSSSPGSAGSVVSAVIPPPGDVEGVSLKGVLREERRNRESFFSTCVCTHQAAHLQTSRRSTPRSTPRLHVVSRAVPASGISTADV